MINVFLRPFDECCSCGVCWAIFAFLFSSPGSRCKLLCIASLSVDVCQQKPSGTNAENILDKFRQSLVFFPPTPVVQRFRGGLKKNRKRFTQTLSETAIFMQRCIRTSKKKYDVIYFECLAIKKYKVNINGPLKPVPYAKRVYHHRVFFSWRIIADTRN